MKLPSEAVGNQREDSRAAVHLLLFAYFQTELSQRAMMHRLKLKCNAHLLPVIFYLTPIYQVQVDRKYAHWLKVADYRSVIFGPAKTGLPAHHTIAVISLKGPEFAST